MLVVEWLEQIERDYIATFVKQGGASVKFVVGNDRQRSELRYGLTKLAQDHDYLVLSADSATPICHRICSSLSLHRWTGG